jgi:large subunit ribosomal protein L22
VKTSLLLDFFVKNSIKMAQHNYAYQKNEENTVRAVGRNLSVSPKQGTEICKYVRGRSLNQAKMLLQQSIDMKRAVPFTRFVNGLGHKSGMSAGRYHPKACSLILGVIKSAEANAKNKGYNASDLKVVHIAMQIGPKNNHQGRQKRSIVKNSHIEVVLREVKGLSAKKNEKAKTDNAVEAKAEKKPKAKAVKKDN